MKDRNLIRYYKMLLSFKAQLTDFSGYGEFEPEFAELLKSVLKEEKRVADLLNEKELHDMLDEKIKDAAASKKDTYLEGLYETIKMCDLVLQNAQSFSTERVQSAQKLRKETEEYIRKREAIPLERRL